MTEHPTDKFLQHISHLMPAKFPTIHPIRQPIIIGQKANHDSCRAAVIIRVMPDKTVAGEILAKQKIVVINIFNRGRGRVRFKPTFSHLSQAPWHLLGDPASI